MIDDGELDWKVIAISEDDPKAASVNDIEDVERWAPAHPICLTTACFRVKGLGFGALGNEGLMQIVRQQLKLSLGMFTAVGAGRAP